MPYTMGNEAVASQLGGERLLDDRGLDARTSEGITRFHDEYVAGAPNTEAL